MFFQFGSSLLDDPNYLIEIIENYPSRLLTFLKVELDQHLRSLNIPYCTPLSRYLHRYNIVEMYLDKILKSGDDSKLPAEVILILFNTYYFVTFFFYVFYYNI